MKDNIYQAITVAHYHASSHSTTHLHYLPYIITNHFVFSLTITHHHFLSHSSSSTITKVLSSTHTQLPQVCHSLALSLFLRFPSSSDSFLCSSQAADEPRYCLDMVYILHSSSLYTTLCSKHSEIRDDKGEESIQSYEMISVELHFVALCFNPPLSNNLVTNGHKPQLL